MLIEYSDLQLLKYLQENPDVPLAKTAGDFYRNPTSIRRQLAAINQMLSGRCYIEVRNSRIRSGLTYADYLDIVRSLTVDTYLPSCKERLQLIIIKAFFGEIVNLTRIYEELGFSVTTKKSDTAKLRPLLSAYGQEVQIARKKGITIIGNELRFRMLVIEILLPLIEWDPVTGIMSRRANTPVQAVMADICIGASLPPKLLNIRFPELWQKTRDYSLSYQSRKLLSLYLCLFVARQPRHPAAEPEQVLLKLPDWNLLHDPWENTALLHIISMLDFDPAPDVPVSPALYSHAVRLCDKVSEQAGIPFFNHGEIQMELYRYLSKIYFQDFYGIQIKDKMVRNTEQQFPRLYQTICGQLLPVSEEFHIHFHSEHYTTLTLILQKWIDYHQLSGLNRKSIVLVTNTSSERSRFFISALEDLVEFDLCAIISIHELERLEHLTNPPTPNAPARRAYVTGRPKGYDFIITLSDRTAGLLANQGFPSLRLEFFLGTKDLEKLLAAGFGTARKRLSAKALADSLSGLTPDEIAVRLKRDYPEYFIY